MSLWRARILAKLLASRLPVSYRRWASLGLFRHGKADDPNYAWRVLAQHVASRKDLCCGWRGLELGPGDGLLTALIAPAFKSSGVTLVDAGSFAHVEGNRYRAALAMLAAQHPSAGVPEFAQGMNAVSMLEAVGGSYLTEGLKSLRSLQSASCDLIWSHAVMEHIRRSEFQDTAFELRRLVAPQGTMSHVIDFKDHLGGGLNNLRFSSERWEKDSFAYRSGFYTNRLRYSEVVDIFMSAGFSVETVSIKRWDRSPLVACHLADEFKKLSDDDLRVSGAHLIMRPR